ncbi:MAG: CDP-diacylglycerol--serine O-phosphatidyltransferase [Candidatus Marinimicrobia bacterium]|nr:CDP-diacylglycerol--serine O-phosphatidyltransferase [Candidatus Neomarinimicrobiota bacterium]MCF7839156.1 CDP-diacylglycerol--serine O-phosphatidyltransferase [Candidatus Neomarinimicrobiota bacterium]MCF7902425.1 CDP-diacylglycerol--serine O-phosphatidyltransferase [Candidatus Neomarinimicrobiota bacterium]
MSPKKKNVDQEGKPRGGRRRFIPSAFTIFNMFFGFLSILSSFQGFYAAAAWYIIVGAMFDSLDGKLARALGSTSEFGIQFDSLADIITFCAAPSVFVFRVWSSDLGFVVGGFFAFFPLMLGSIRLAKFNLEATGEQKNRFIGMPTPMGALSIVGMYLFFSQVHNYPWLHWYPRNEMGDARIALPFVMIISFLLLSKIPFPKFPALAVHRGWVDNWKFILTIVLMALVILTKGFLLLPILLLIIISGLAAWTQEARMSIDSKEG